MSDGGGSSTKRDAVADTGDLPQPQHQQAEHDRRGDPEGPRVAAGQQHQEDGADERRSQQEQGRGHSRPPRARTSRACVASTKATAATARNAAMNSADQICKVSP